VRSPAPALGPEASVVSDRAAFRPSARPSGTRRVRTLCRCPVPLCGDGTTKAEPGGGTHARLTCCGSSAARPDALLRGRPAESLRPSGSPGARPSSRPGGGFHGREMQEGGGRKGCASRPQAHTAPAHSSRGLAETQRSERGWGDLSPKSRVLGWRAGAYALRLVPSPRCNSLPSSVN